MRAKTGSRDIALVSLTSALDGGEWLMPCTSLVTPKNDQYSFDRRLGGSWGQS